MAILSQARQLLARAQTIKELLKVRNLATAAERYFKAANVSRDAEKEAAEIRLRAERQAGKMLTDMRARGERVDRGHNSTKLELQSATPTLSDLGVEKTQSHRWQAIAAIPDDVFESYIGGAREDESRELTTAGLKQTYKAAEREQRQTANEALVAQAPERLTELDGRRFQTLVLDPPWDWGDEGDIDQMGRGRPTYATMPIAEICGLPVGNLAADNAHLYLWITNRSLPKGFGLLEAWGFRYVTMLTWVKPSFGMGNYFRGSTEHVLFGVRGSLPLLRNDAATHFNANRGGPHSAKPDEFYRLVETCSPGPWLELFARRERPGWITRGAEVEGAA